ncbi:MAG: hypothetical protein ACI92Z_003117 [Paracoccaceae bacterium]|jgi:hypothetical protein
MHCRAVNEPKPHNFWFAKIPLGEYSIDLPVDAPWFFKGFLFLHQDTVLTPKPIILMSEA